MHVSGWEDILKSSIQTAGTIFGPQPTYATPGINLPAPTQQQTIDAALGVPTGERYQLVWAEAAPDYSWLVLPALGIGALWLFSRSGRRR